MSKAGQKGSRASAELDHSEVSFPAGSFDHATLHETLDRAAAAPDSAKRQALIDEATVAGNQTPIGVAETPAEPVGEPPVTETDQGQTTETAAQD